MSRGCIQGSVCGPTFWNLILDELLQTKLPDNCHLQAFADDVLLVVHSKDVASLQSTTNSILKTIIEWGTQSKLTFGPSKTQLIAFTPKAKQATIRIDSIDLSFVNEIKVLGVIIDNRLRFIRHAEYIINKGLKIYKSLCKFIRPTWGIQSENVSIIYQHVIEPIITYASGIWGTAIKYKGVKKKLTSFQRGFSVKAIRGFRTISANASIALSGFTPLHLKINEVATVELTKLRGSTQLLPNDVQLHRPTPPSKMLHPAARKSINFESATSDEDIQKICNPNFIKIYTDGSRHSGDLVGAAFVAYKPQGEPVEVKLKLHPSCSVFQAEVLAIEKALMWAHDTAVNGVAILSDSLSALHEISDRDSTNSLVNSIQKYLITFPVPVIFIWTKAHVGVRGNEEADKAAKMAASMQKTPDFSFFPISYVRRLIKERNLAISEQDYLASPKGEHTRKWLPDLAAIKELFKVTKTGFHLTQILTGHGFHQISMPGKIKVKVLAGRNLPVMDRASDTTDAFVEIKFGNVTHKTDVCRKTLNPHWSSTEWYRFEVDESELQDEPLQLRLMDHDTYSANDAIGKVVISLAPLLAREANNAKSASPPGAVLSGWIPVFDTMHGIRGELNVIVKVELFSDFNKYKTSSCGVQFFHCPSIPAGYKATAIHGFVEELVVNDDPEYQWIDKIRTPRASNEARQVAFIKLSNQVQRLVGLKAAELGANAVVGYQQDFDLEGEAGVVARAIGTAVSLIPPPSPMQPIHIPPCTQQQLKKYLDILATDDETVVDLNQYFRHHQQELQRLLNIMNPKTPTLLDEPENVDEDEKNDFPRQTSVKNFINWYQDEDVSQKSLKHISEDQTDLNKLLRGNEDSDSDSTGPLKKIKKLKTTFTRRLGSLRSRKSEKQDNDNVSLQSNSSDTSRISLTDLKHEFKKFKRLKKPKFRKTFTNTEDEGIGMASILARSVIHVHTSLACIAEKESEHSPCSTMRRTSESEPTVNISDDEHNKNDERNISESKAKVPEIHASLKNVNVDEPDITTRRERKLSESCPASPMAERSENYLKLPKETGYFGSLSLSGDSSEAYTSSDEDGEISSSDQNVDFDKSVETTSSVVQSVLNKNVDPAFIAHIERKLSLLEGTIPELKESKSHGVFENISELQSDTNLETSKSSPCIHQNNDSIEDTEEAKRSLESSHNKHDQKHSLMHTAMETILIDKVKALLPPSAEVIDTDDENTDAEHHDTEVESNVKSPSLFHTAMETILLEKAQVLIPPGSQPATPDGTSLKFVDTNVPKIPEHVENVKGDLVQSAIETILIDKVQTLIPSHSESVSYRDSIESSTPDRTDEIKNYGNLFIPETKALHADKGPILEHHSLDHATCKDQLKNSVVSNVSETLQVSRKPTSSLFHSAMETILMDKVQTLTTVSEQISDISVAKSILQEQVNPVVADHTNENEGAYSNLRKINNDNGDPKLNASTPDYGDEKLEDAKTSDNKGKIFDKIPNVSELKTKDGSSADNKIMNANDTKDKRLVRQDSLHSLDNDEAESQKMSKETSANITVSPRIDQSKPVLQHFHPILSGKPLETIPSLPESSLDHSESLDIDGVDQTLTSQTEFQCKPCDSESNSASVCGNSHAACDVDRNEREKENIFEKEKEREKESPHHARHDSCGAREPVAISQSTQNSSFTPSTPLGIHRRSSDSDLSVTPKGGSLNASLGNAGSGGGAILRPSMNSSNIEMLEYPFLTMTEYPPGLIVHLGGTVCARSVKLVDAGGESASRAAWWAELRTELRAHARALRCNAVIAYTESAAICEDVCVLSASGTAAVINLDCDFGNDIEIATSLVTNGRQNGSDEGSETEQCGLAHVPYSPGAGPYRAELSTCGGCRKARVPAVLLATCAKPNRLPAYAKAVTITAVAARLRRAPPAAEPGARDISDQLPFLEYELHKLLLAKLRMQGANALFSLRTQITIGERCVMALASGTAVRVVALPPPTPPRIKASDVDKNALEIQRAVWDSFTANKAANGYDIGGSADTILPSVALPELENEDAPALDLCADKDACVLELDEAEDVETAKTLAVRRAHMPVFTSNMKPAKGAPPQMFAQVQAAPAAACALVQPASSWSCPRYIRHYIQGCGKVQAAPAAALRARAALLPAGAARGTYDTTYRVVVRYKLRRLQPARSCSPASSWSCPRYIRDYIQGCGRYKLRPLQPCALVQPCFQLELPEGCALDGVAYKLRRLQPCALVQPCFQLELPEDEIQLIVSGSAISLVDPSKPEPINEPGYNHSNHSSPQQQSYSSHYHGNGNNGGNNSDNEDDIFALDEEQLAKTPPPPVENANADDKSLIFNGQVPTTVSLTTLGFVSGSRSERRICALRLLFVRETTAVRELGGLSGFLHTFTCEVLAIVRAYTAALGGNALTSFYITQLMLQDNAHKNQGQCLLSVGGDVVQISY
ncbi:c2 domain-containing protein [Phthorimaea operculella]|nr:c2 domain-containing protein [Phthorimaea operculella]